MESENQLKIEKRPRVPRQAPSECLECGSDKGYQPSRACKTVLFHGDRVELDYERMVCPDCGTALLGDKQIDQSLDCLNKLYQGRGEPPSKR